MTIVIDTKWGNEYNGNTKIQKGESMMDTTDYKIITLRLGNWDMQRDIQFKVEPTITAEKIREKYNKCIDTMKKEKIKHSCKEDFIIQYLEQEYGWERLLSNYVIIDRDERFDKIQDSYFSKVYLEEK